MSADKFFEGSWDWYWSESDGETCNGPHATKEEAIDDAVDNDANLDETAGTCTFTVLEAHKASLKFSDCIDIESIDERAHDGPWEDLLNEDGDALTKKVTRPQWVDLERRLRAVADEWQIANGIVITPWVFMKTRNEETVTVPARVIGDPSNAEAVEG